METIESAISRNTEVYNEISEWIEDEYEREFLDYFVIPDSLYAKLKRDKITDDELSEILINLPLDLMQVSSKLSEYKLFKEVIKIESKRLKSSTLDVECENKSDKLFNNELIMIGQTNLIEKVERKISMCKELIMGAKKIWDARRSIEHTNPISEIDDESNNLPDYK